MPKAYERSEVEAPSDLFQVYLRAARGEAGEKVRKLYLGQIAERDLGRQKKRPSLFDRKSLKLLYRMSVLERERARASAPERAHRRTAAERAADIRAERAYVRPL